MINLLVMLLVILVVAYIIYWIIGLLPVPANFKWILYVILGLAVIIYLLSRIGFRF